MTADLRRLAEQMIVDEDVAAILALLDERDRLREDYRYNGEQWHARVAALEEGLRAMLAAFGPDWDYEVSQGYHEELEAKARALLAAANESKNLPALADAPSEPARYMVGDHGVANGGNDPAALPAEDRDPDTDMPWNPEPDPWGKS